MAATTMRLLGKVVLASDAANITFSDIPGTGYTDLFLVASLRSSRNVGSNSGLYVTFNGFTTNFSYRHLYGDGSNATSINGSTNYCGVMCQGTDTANTFGSAEIYIPNYAGSSNKSFSATSVQEKNATGANTMATASMWSNTAAITSIKLEAEAGSFNIVANSSAFLYGITKA